MTTWLIWGTIILLVVLGLGLVSLWSTGRFAKRKMGSVSVAIPARSGTALDDLLTPLERQYQGHSGVRLIADPIDALRTRMAAAHIAQRSLDLLYYIWDDDLSGRLLAQAMLEAADRGVRVRMLLDDVNVLNHDPVYRSLDRHPQIEVRLFNPIRNRDRGFLRGLEIVFNLLPLNRRMHGKLWITDGRYALTGGRNVGDVYFGLNDGPGYDYDDLDTALAGAVVGEAEALFDTFWNSGLALPIRTLWPGKHSRLSRFRRRLSRFLSTPEAQARLAALALPPPSDAAAALGISDLRWVPDLIFLGDPPQKTLGKAPDGWMPEILLPLLRNATHSLRIMTPYFVPGTQGLAELTSLARKGVKVEIITNGLALSDNVLVYGAYRWYRARLLASGIRVFEVAAQSGPRRMLHSKAFLIDGTTGFVGSFNFDLRSAFLNTELGVVFTDPSLIADLRADFDQMRAPEHAFAVSLNGRWPAWSRGDGAMTYLEPESNALKRAVSFFIGHLPIHRFL